MSCKIRVLNEHTINKIAAGEVIENPASVIKELVENSIDAGSTEICIEIKGGGRQLIRVTDNGCGMGPDDALLCLERHATSKIRSLEDIYALHTMGFRGEAIPSIASISKFTLLTYSRPSDGTSSKPPEGTMILVDGGKIIKCSPAARNPGTTIEVKSLFFNVPVRKKFQKSPAHDTNEILKMLSVLALGNPTIRFELISDQKCLLSTSPRTESTFPERLGQSLTEVLGKDFFEETCQIQGQKGDYHLQGFIGLPSHSRHNRTGQYLFINQRGVFSPLIAFAVRQGYGTTLPPNRHPVYVLHLTVPGSSVDVNVHPQKKEVKLRHEQLIKDLVSQAVSQALQNQCISWVKEEASPSFIFETALPPEPPFAFSMPPEPQFKSDLASWEAQSASPVDKPSSFPTSFHIHFADEKPLPAPKIRMEQPVESPTLFDVMPTRRTPRVMTAFPGYLLLDPATLPSNERFSNIDRSGLYLVDQRAAHSRVIFEKLIQLSENSEANSTFHIQALLIPYTLDLTPIEAHLLRQNLDGIHQFGIQVREIGPSTFAVEGLPQVLEKADINSLIHSILQSLRDFNDTQALKKEQQKAIALNASRMAIGRQSCLSLQEGQALADQLFSCKMPYQCPVGKATVAYISQEELSKLFQKS